MNVIHQKTLYERDPPEYDGDKELPLPIEVQDSYYLYTGGDLPNITRYFIVDPNFLVDKFDGNDEFIQVAAKEAVGDIIFPSYDKNKYGQQLYMKETLQNQILTVANMKYIFDDVHITIII